MAKHLDLEEQEQLDQIKHFWAQYGNLITWVLIIVLGAMAAWNGWRYWERSQSTKAAVLHDELERAAEARDTARLEDALGKLREGFGSTTQASQGALLAAKAFHEQGKQDAARSALSWVVDKGADEAYQAVARLRLAALELEAGQHEQALKRLDGKVPADFQGLFEDRRGDILLAQGKPDEARKHFESAWKSLGERNPYRKLVEVKLASLGVAAASLTASKEP
ncbi:MAG: tetratricopeptide repeat protein [Hydrogenophaga sp.]|jgi:predicted negative regulator of RcsB-dependent stress response|uniref:YfgM family protein n=1 Tax=Hydrogenophaga sp. TaxID=1904254 RepID=UPI0035B4020C|nr:tetratricopeptide repeat protein [Hydrogenophaga sp.]